MESTAFKQEAFYQAAWNQLHLITLHGNHCIQSGCIFPGCMESTAFNNAAGNHCILSCCMESTALNRVPFLHPAWNPLHSTTLHGIHCIQSRCILPLCMYYRQRNQMQCNPCRVVKGSPMECSGLHAAWLNAVDSMQGEEMEPI